MPTSKRLASLGNAVFARVDAAKHAYRVETSSSARPDLVDLSIGSSDLRPPTVLLDTMASAVMDPRSGSYCLQAGLRPLHAAVADWCRHRFDVAVDPDHEVQFLVGSQEGTAHLPLALLDPGDAALHLDPCYPSHTGGLHLAGASSHALALSPEQDWRPDLTALSPQRWDQLKLFVLGYPHNPSARVGNQDDLNRIMATGAQHDVVIAHDNPYVDLALDGEPPSLLQAPNWRECGIEFFSLSKGWCLGGFRLGFAVGASPLIAALRRIKAVIDFNQSLALQQGAIQALQSFPDWPRQLHPIYRERRDRVVETLTARGWSVPCPEMAMYLWFPLPDGARHRGWSDEDAARELLQRSGVALTPGSGFGAGGRDWLRMALVRPVDELMDAASRLADAMDE
ncbi:MAG: aminotransferase class I/II-fold pyridoxal phosphate-dependent enzyme [Synechococcus sp. BS301-5m-G53]|nr:aminotransferase class I/II-fold pyridoxal phosphate-dependent enzyme [Synechococcus sp. BS301-5m-G53]